MAWSIQQDENGISQGRLTFEEATSGRYGLWLLGDEDGMKETPQFTQKLRLKLWCATSEKYSARDPHYPSLPVHDGRTEDVLCFTGDFFCWAEGREHSLEYPNSISLGPNEERAWSLPMEYELMPAMAKPAYGISICRYVPTAEIPLQFGAGSDYIVRLFDRRHQSEYFSEPILLLTEDVIHWDYCLWLPWRGVTRFHVNDTDYYQPPHSFTYIPREVLESKDKDWEMHVESEDFAGICVHY